MKKTALFFLAAVAVILSGAGTARADRGFWFSKTDGSWETYINVQNTNATTAYVATVTFYDMSGGVLGSTSQTLQPLGSWSFGAQSAVTPTTTQLNAANGVAGANPRGPVKITSNSGTAGTVRGYTTIANSTMNGFNFRIPMDTLAGD